MTDAVLVEGLRQFVVAEILDGEDVGLTDSTQLLELGILNSMEILSLIAFVEARFHVTVPPDQILADNFKDLRTIAGFVTALGGGGSMPPAAAR